MSMSELDWERVCQSCESESGSKYVREVRVSMLELEWKRVCQSCESKCGSEYVRVVRVSMSEWWE